MLNRLILNFAHHWNLVTWNTVVYNQTTFIDGRTYGRTPTQSKSQPKPNVFFLFYSLYTSPFSTSPLKVCDMASSVYRPYSDIGFLSKWNC